MSGKIFDEQFDSISGCIQMTYSSEATYQSIIFEHLITAGVARGEIVVEFPWIDNVWSRGVSPGREGPHIDMVVMAAPPSDIWHDIKVYGPKDYKNAALAIEIKRYTNDYWALHHDIDRLAKIQQDSNGMTDVRFILIDDKIYIKDIKVRKQYVSAANRAVRYAENCSVPVRLISFGVVDE